MNLKLAAALSATALAAATFTSFVPAASAAQLPPIMGPAAHLLQSLEQQVSDLSHTIAGFAQSFTTNDLTFTSGTGNQLTVQTLCVGTTCINEAQLQALLASQNTPATQSDASNAAVSNATTTNATTTIEESPIIQINGDNPAIVQVGDTYQDLGAIITGPQDDLNLGIQTFVNGSLMSPVVIDTSAPATDTIDYVATDQNGLTSTSTRVVIVEATSIVTTDDASSTDATTTGQ